MILTVSNLGRLEWVTAAVYTAQTDIVWEYSAGSWAGHAWCLRGDGWKAGRSWEHSWACPLVLSSMAATGKSNSRRWKLPIHLKASTAIFNASQTSKPEPHPGQPWSANYWVTWKLGWRKIIWLPHIMRRKGKEAFRAKAILITCYSEFKTVTPKGLKHVHAF